MPDNKQFHQKSLSQINRRSLLRGGAAVAAGAGGALVFPGMAAGAASGGQVENAAGAMRAVRYARARAAAAVPVPPVVRSRRALGETGFTSGLPLTQGGVTYDIAQEVVWVDTEHFAVGRWDGSMSIFSFETAQYAGPLINTVVNTPGEEGVQMITLLPGHVIATSNDNASLSLWLSPAGHWADLVSLGTRSYDPSLGVATNGAWLPAGQPSTLVVGHDSGYVSLWSYNPRARALSFVRSVGLQNPKPVNPFNSHVIYGMTTLTQAGPTASVVAGSDDGYISIVAVPSGKILSQTVFNPAAQRGINSVSVTGNKLLVTNCSVGANDYNTWYFTIDMATYALTLIDKANLIIDTSLVQAFNFDAIWGSYSSGPCWFASTEEGVLWMGTADTSLNVIGYQNLSDRAFGAALAFTGGPGRLAVVIDDLNQFITGSP
jgi:hypothetical protein